MRPLLKCLYVTEPDSYSQENSSRMQLSPRMPLLLNDTRTYQGCRRLQVSWALLLVAEVQIIMVAHLVAVAIHSTCHSTYHAPSRLLRIPTHFMEELKTLSYQEAP